MTTTCRNGRPTLGVLTGWQFYRTATNLSYLAPVFRGICRAAQDLDCNILLGCGIGPSASPTDPLRPAWPYPSEEHDFIPIGPWNTDGLIIANPLNSKARSGYAQGLIAAGHPILFIGSGETGPTIVADNTGGIAEALAHMIDHGHRQIAFIAGSQDDMQGDSGDRLKAYQSGCELFGLVKNPALIAYGRHVFDGGFSAMEQILDSGVPFSAVLASNDESALGAMQALKHAGRKIPEDVAVIGFDNRLEGAVHEPALTSIHVPLFDIGYRSVELMLQHLEENVELAGVVKIDTPLVLRVSCGCHTRTFLPPGIHQGTLQQPAFQQEQRAMLARTIAASITNQAHSLTEAECVSYCQRLVDTFVAGLQSEDRTEFRNTLNDVLVRTTAGDDDAHIWQDAISILGNAWREDQADIYTVLGRLQEIVNEARLAISAQMQRQHRLYVANEQWVSSRLSLLTSRLLSTLEEPEIYEILANNLPEMDIPFALLGQYEGEGNDPVAWSTVRNLTVTEQMLVRFPTREFPPSELINPEQPFILTLIPLVDRPGQTGFMVFGTEHFDLYGAVVQQVGVALNSAWLYRQATEGRQMAEEANQMKSRFLSTVSHELRTPLNLILGLSGILLDDSDEGKAPLPELVQKDVERIHAYAQHLGGLISDVLDLATSDAGQLRLNMELIDLGDVLQLAVESGSQLALDKGLSWRVNLPDTGCWVWGDRTRLRQVVLNLINNAIKFTQQGEVRLAVEAGAHSVTVRVSDTGLGIPQDEQTAIFDEFRQSARSISLGYPGLGLGLAISKMLIQMHNGTIGVKSSGVEGEGSTFSFTLPVVQPATVPLMPAPRPLQGEVELEELTQALGHFWQSADPGHPIRTFLVVDDEEDTLEMNVRIVQAQSSYNRVLKAHNGQEALLILQKEKVDLVLLDLQMPEMDGFGMLEAMRANRATREIPVIIMTGKALTEQDMKRLSQGVAVVLKKGLFGINETVAHLSAALARKRSLSLEAQRLVRQAMVYLHAHYTEQISRREIAQHIGIAEDYLTFCFRQELGITPIKYLQRFRVNQAQHLLKTTQKTITEIAFDVGFADSGYFSRIFHRETGRSPEDFRSSR